MATSLKPNLIHPDCIHQTSPTIIGIGEGLFDVFHRPSGEKQARLGGAPLNVSVHAAQLGQHAGKYLGKHLGPNLRKQAAIQSAMLTCVGDDDLGEELKQTLIARGVDPSLVQTDSQHTTGQVDVIVDEEGKPTYTIHTDTAWDHIQATDQAIQAVQQAQALCFGTLAQQGETSRQSIQKLLSVASQTKQVNDSPGCPLRLLDVNLRGDFDDANLLDLNLKLATALKLSDEELPVVMSLLNLSSQDEQADCHQLFQTYGLDFIAYTRGRLGTRIITPNLTVDGIPAKRDLENGDGDQADTVGAGDSVAATLLVGCVCNWSWQIIADTANRVGAAVASRSGATPVLDVPSLLDYSVL